MKRLDFYRLLKYSESAEEIDEYREAIVMLLPQAKRMFDYNLKSRSHQYDLWMHSLHTVAELPRGMDDNMLYLAALLHDMGKPDCRRHAGRGYFSYPGHPNASARIARENVSKAFGLKESEKDRLCYYISHHEDHPDASSKYTINWFVHQMGLVSIDTFRNLMLLQIADARAHADTEMSRRRAEICSMWADPHYVNMMFDKYMMPKIPHNV